MIDTVLLKVASRCNLDCSYCYVYHMGDEGWRDQPKRMSYAVQLAAARQLANLHSRLQRRLQVVMHGGEPLLIGPKRLERLCSLLHSALPAPNEIHVQTNGVLLTDEIIDIFVHYDVGISISLDGPPNVHDRFRIDRRGQGSHDRVHGAIARLMSRDDARTLLTGVLAVIDPSSNPVKVYDYLKATGTPSIDFLVRDGNHMCLPVGKEGVDSTEFGRWMAKVLDTYLSDPEPPRVRVFDDMLRLIMGGKANKEGLGTIDYGILVVDTDGRINKNDTLKVAHAGADRFDDPSWSILSDDILDIVQSSAYLSYYRQQRPTADVCRDCAELHVCGGGMVAHRWSDERGYDNPTIFCADQQLLIARMREWLKYRESA